VFGQIYLTERLSAVDSLAGPPYTAWYVRVANYNGCCHGNQCVRNNVHYVKACIMHSYNCKSAIILSIKHVFMCMSFVRKYSLYCGCNCQACANNNCCAFLTNLQWLLMPLPGSASSTTNHNVHCRVHVQVPLPQVRVCCLGFQWARLLGRHDVHM
jgi:hypothetical protein